MMFIRSFTGRKLSTYIKTSHIFALMTAPLRCPDYTCVSKRGKSVNVSFPPPPHTWSEISHLVGLPPV
ncbi:transposase [Pectobacterium aroidearum]|nr:transposase [Pectobacterium aroidearum]